MKAMILVLKHKECMNLLKGDLSILVRRKFSKDFVGWIYVCWPKDEKLIWLKENSRCEEYINGKVVAKVWCSKVEKLIDRDTKEKNHYSLGTETLQIDELEKMSCLDIQELCKYIGKGTRCLCGDYGYAIHINNLKIFDKPKDLWRFKTPIMAKRYKYDLEKAYEDDCEIGTRIAEGVANDDECANCVELTELSEGYYGLSRAPRSGWCYVESID